MKDKKNTLLVISHIEPLRVFIIELLNSADDYKIFSAANEAHGMELISRETPNLIVLDIMTPRIEEYQLTWLLHSADKQHIPIIILSTGGVQQYFRRKPDIKKSFCSPSSLDSMILIDRVETVLRRQDSSFEANPLLRFPGNIELGQELQARPVHLPRFAIGYAELYDLKAYNEYYNTTQGDQILLHTREIIEQAVKQFGTPHDITKHLSGNDFVFITIPEKVDVICQHIIHIFDQEIPNYYDKNDQFTSSFIFSTAQHGISESSPLLTLSIAVVTNLHREFIDFGEIGEIASAIKKYLKALPGSNYIVDRRGNK